MATPKRRVSFDVRPWDAEKDMEFLKKAIPEAMEMDGLVWEHSTVVTDSGIKKLQLQFVVEKDNVPYADKIEDLVREKMVQSVYRVSITPI